MVPLRTDAAGDGADLAHLEELQHLGLAQHRLPLLGLEQALERVAHVLHRLVDDAVGAHVHLLPLRGRAGVGVGPDVEAEDDRARRLGEQDVALGDGADAAVDHVHPHLAGAELRQRVGQRFGRAALVGLDDDAERGDLALLERAAEVLQACRRVRCGGSAPRARAAAASARSRAPRPRRSPPRRCRRRPARPRSRGSAPESTGRPPSPSCRARRSSARTRPENLPQMKLSPTREGALLHQDRGERTLARIERRLEHGAVHLARRDWP